jgi:hypothetical protein
VRIESRAFAFTKRNAKGYIGNTKRDEGTTMKKQIEELRAEIADL